LAAFFCLCVHRYHGLRSFTLVGPVLAVRPYCHNDNYWQVYFDGNRIIREALAEAGFPAPMPAQLVMVQNPQG